MKNCDDTCTERFIYTVITGVCLCILACLCLQIIPKIREYLYQARNHFEDQGNTSTRPHFTPNAQSSV